METNDCCCIRYSSRGWQVSSCMCIMFRNRLRTLEDDINDLNAFRKLAQTSLQAHKKQTK